MPTMPWLMVEKWSQVSPLPHGLQAPNHINGTASKILQLPCRDALTQGIGKRLIPTESPPGWQHCGTASLGQGQLPSGPTLQHQGCLHMTLTFSVPMPRSSWSEWSWFWVGQKGGWASLRNCPREAEKQWEARLYENQAHFLISLNSTYKTKIQR